MSMTTHSNHAVIKTVKNAIFLEDTVDIHLKIICLETPVLIIFSLKYSNEYLTRVSITRGLVGWLPEDSQVCV